MRNKGVYSAWYIGIPYLKVGGYTGIPICTRINIPSNIPTIYLYTNMTETLFIPTKYPDRIMAHRSTFDDYLQVIFGKPKADKARTDYRLGGTVDRKTIFWQIDYLSNVRTGKVITYKTDGHRDKSVNPAWVHTDLIRLKVLPSTFHVQQCLFGEHLLHDNPGKPVALVEAEKTAVICSLIYPSHVWVSVGGMAGLSAERCKALRCRDVTIFPDTDTEGKTFADWQLIAHEHLRHICHTLTVSDVLERFADDTQKKDKIDIADLLTLNL